MIPIVSDALCIFTKGLIKGVVDLESQRASGDHPNDRIIKIGRNAKENLGDFRRHAVTQTPVENHQLTLVRKTLK